MCGERLNMISLGFGSNILRLVFIITVIESLEEESETQMHTSSICQRFLEELATVWLIDVAKYFLRHYERAQGS